MSDSLADGSDAFAWVLGMPSDRARHAVVLVMLVTASACATPTVDGLAPAYDPTALTGGAVYHWPVGERLSLHVVPGAGAADEELRDAVAVASAAWTGALGYREHTLRLVDDAAAADIIVRDAGTASPVDTGCGGPGWTDAAASTFFCPLGDTARTLPLLSGAAGRTKVLITISAEDAVATTGLLPIVVHEIGHALGIGGHSPVAGDAMFSAPTTSSPSLRDARTLRYLLHRRADVTL